MSARFFLVPALILTLSFGAHASPDCGRRLGLGYRLPRRVRLQLLHLRLHLISPSGIRLELTDSSHGVVLYRVMSQIEYDQVKARGRFDSTTLGGKGFSLFWVGSVSQGFYLSRKAMGDDAEYGRVIKITVAPRFFELLARVRLWRSMDGRGEGYDLGTGPIRGGDVMLLQNAELEAQHYPGEAVERAPRTRGKIDEVNLSGAALELLNEFIQNIEDVTPGE